jgi:hypothetical protein
MRGLGLTYRTEASYITWMRRFMKSTRSIVMPCGMVVAGAPMIRAPIGALHSDQTSRFQPSFSITSPNSSASLGSSLVLANGFETQVSLMRSRHEMLWLVLLPPHEPQPSEKV